MIVTFFAKDSSLLLPVAPDTKGASASEGKLPSCRRQSLRTKTSTTPTKSIAVSMFHAPNHGLLNFSTFPSAPLLNVENRILVEVVFSVPVSRTSADKTTIFERDIVAGMSGGARVAQRGGL